MSPEYEKGFNAGIEFATKNFNTQTGRYSKAFPDTFQHRVGIYNCGFGEGLITGRSEVIDKTFGELKSIHWSNGKPVIER